MYRLHSAIVLVLAHCWWAAAASALPRPEFAHPPDVDYDQSIPHPRETLGFEVGDWHVRPDQLVTYLERLSDASERVEIERIGASHEGRPLINAFFSTPENFDRLDRCVEQRESGDQASQSQPSAQCPLVVQLGYSVHGNEASGSNASVLMAYYLAASKDPETLEWLENAVVIIDPCLNPDGLARFAHWANMHRGRVAVGDEMHREHREHWPNGRTNHYWFDLNRDWLLLTQPESRARLAAFHRFRPHVVGDFHEMGSNQTYFFQPGVPTRQNPLTPPQNLELTAEIATFHGRALDAIGTPFYTGESFDDFYFGKGSTYPDINGSVGILFEQASARGRLKDTPHGQLTFARAITHQLATSLSTVRGAVAIGPQLHEYRDWFDRSALQEAKQESVRGFLFGDRHDIQRTNELVNLLTRHQIEVRPIRGEPNGRFEAGSAYWVAIDQPQYRLIKSLFEPQTEFTDSTFYDVSTWTMPLAFGLPFEPRRTAPAVGEPIDQVLSASGSFAQNSDAVAYAFAWSPYDAPHALGQLHAANIKTRVATRPWTSTTSASGAPRYGDILIPLGIQSQQRQIVEQHLESLASRTSIDIFAIERGLNPDGPDLGSPSLRPLESPRPALLVGGQSSTYQAGQIWHLLDHRFAIETTLLDWRDLDRADLDRYSHLIVVGGRYSTLDEKRRDRLSEWIRNGGTWIGIKEGARLADQVVAGSDRRDSAEPSRSQSGTDKAPEESVDDSKNEERKRIPYGEYRDRRAVHQVNGSIFQASFDLSHPLAYGYRRPEVPLFRTDREILETPSDPYATVGVYTPEPLLSGYASAENVERIAGSAALTATRQGRGVVIRFADDPSFRAIWLGAEKLFLNSVFFSSVIDTTGDTGPPR